MGSCGSKKQVPGYDTGLRYKDERYVRIGDLVVYHSVLYFVREAKHERVKIQKVANADVYEHSPQWLSLLYQCFVSVSWEQYLKWIVHVRAVELSQNVPEEDLLSEINADPDLARKKYRFDREFAANPIVMDDVLRPLKRRLYDQALVLRWSRELQGKLRFPDDMLQY